MNYFHVEGAQFSVKELEPKEIKNSHLLTTYFLKAAFKGAGHPRAGDLLHQALASSLSTVVLRTILEAILYLSPEKPFQLLSPWSATSKASSRL